MNPRLLLIVGLALLTALLYPSPTNAQSYNIQLGDCVYTEDSVNGFNYASTAACEGFLNMINDVAREIDTAWVATSGSSLSVSTGSKTLSVNAGRGFAAGQPVRIVRTSDPTDVYMDGVITAWSDVTDVMEVTIDAVDTTGGSGPYTDWSVFVVRSRSTVVSSPLGISDGGTGGTSAPSARTNLSTAHYLLVKGFASFPPGSPSSGDTYIMFAGAGGAWSGYQEHNLAVWSGSWSEVAAEDAMVAYVETSVTNSGDPELYLFNGAEWKIVGNNEGKHMPVNGIVSFTVTLGNPNGIFYEVPAASLSGNIVITLPDPATLGSYETVIYRVDASANTVTLNVSGGATIDGASSITVSAGAAKVIRGYANSGKVRTTAG